MRKYYIADLLTLSEVILAGILLWMTIFNVHADYALWVFVAGELCDALDGPCARRWHYPDDGKYRWWRHYNSEIDQISDILLAVACGLYLIFRVNPIGGCLLLLGIGTFCVIVQYKLYGYDRDTHRFRRKNYIYAEQLILFRRKVYVFIGIGGTIALLVWATSWSIYVKVGLALVGIVAGIYIANKKRNRLTEDQTPL